MDLLAPDRTPVWTTAFMAGAYLTATACHFWGVREGARTAWWRGLVELGGYAFLAIGFHGFLSLGEPRPLVSSVAFSDRLGSVPLCIVFLAASVTYAAWKLAQLASMPSLAQALIAGLAMFNLSLLLEPVLATSLGLWRWNLDNVHLVWLAAPTLLVATANLLSPAVQEKGVLVALVLAIAVGLYSLPEGLSPLVQWTLTTAAVAAALIPVLRSARGSETQRALPLLLTVPTGVTLAVALLALVVEGLFVSRPSLVLVGLSVGAIATLLVLGPYRAALRQVCDGLIDLDRFVRYHYFGFPALLVLLAAATVRPDPDARLILGLLAAAACFHLHGYVLNDWIDLDLDRTQPRRQADPLVRGAVSREAAFAFAIALLPVAALVCLLMRVGPGAALALGVALALGLVYNVWGKRTPIPPLTDFIQALGWGALALFGALAAQPAAALGDVLGMALPVIAYAIGFIFLINGVHGGLRDLVSDRDGERMTTAIFFGARGDPRDPEMGSVSSPALALFAFSVHTLMFLPSFGLLLHGAEYYAAGWYAASWGSMATLFATSCYQLWRVTRRLEDDRSWWVSFQLFVLVLPPLALYLPSTIPSPAIKVLVVCSVVIPLLAQERNLSVLRQRYLADSRHARAA